MTRYICTGGAGFVGSHITNHLLGAGHHVIVVDNLYAGHENFVPKHPNCEFLKLDISNWNELSKNFNYFSDAKGVFHTAACARIQPSIKNPNITHDYNVTGTLNILQMMRMCGIPSIVYSGSSSYYGDGAKIPCCEDDIGNPQTPYAITKHMGELYCQTWSKIYNTRCAILRYFNVYGPRSPLSGSYAPVIGLFFRQAFERKNITVIGDGEQRRDFSYVTDVVRANVAAMKSLNSANWKSIDRQIFNIGTGKNYSINEVAVKVQQTMRDINDWTAIENTPARQGEARETRANNSKACKILKWKPEITLDEGIEDLKNYYFVNKDNMLLGKYDF